MSFLIGGEGVSNPYPDVVVPDDGFSFGSGGSNAILFGCYTVDLVFRIL